MRPLQCWLFPSVPSDFTGTTSIAGSGHYQTGARKELQLVNIRREYRIVDPKRLQPHNSSSSSGANRATRGDIRKQHQRMIAAVCKQCRLHASSTSILLYRFYGHTSKQSFHYSSSSPPIKGGLRKVACRYKAIKVAWRYRGVVLITRHEQGISPQ